MEIRWIIINFNVKIFVSGELSSMEILILLHILHPDFSVSGELSSMEMRKRISMKSLFHSVSGELSSMEIKHLRLW